MSHSHLTLNQRIQIDALLVIKTKQKYIAQKLGLSESTISKEIKRNSCRDNYVYYHAQGFANYRRKTSKSPYKTNDPDLLKYVKIKLKKDKWSPQQISLRMKRDIGKTLSTESIYLIVYKNRELIKYLKRSKKPRRRNRRNSSTKHGICNRVSIHKRPKLVEARSRVGHWELDTIIGAKQQGVIASFVERKSRFTILKKMTNKSAAEMLKVSLEAFKGLPKSKLRSFTSDNGKEFAFHQTVSKELNTKFYFADPYSSWQRGTNENTNGLVREFLPKKMPLDKVTQKQLDKIALLLNLRPRLCLNGFNPHEIFYKF